MQPLSVGVREGEALAHRAAPRGDGIGLSCGRLRGGPPNHVYLELQNVASLVNKVSVD